jgi:hypothetical protein
MSDTTVAISGEKISAINHHRTLYQGSGGLLLIGPLLKKRLDESDNRQQARRQVR